MDAPLPGAIAHITGWTQFEGAESSEAKWDEGADTTAPAAFPTGQALPTNQSGFHESEPFSEIISEEPINDLDIR